MIHIDINTDVIKANCDDDLTPKIIQYQGKRYCIRLEAMYWEILEAEAKSKGYKLNQIVHENYTHPDAESNKTAYLRRHTVEWLAKSLADRQNQMDLNLSEINCILQTTHRAAFIFTENFSISRHNQSFRDWISKQTNVTKIDAIDKLRVSFRASSRVLIERINKNGGMVHSEPIAILLPGFALTAKIDVIKIKNYAGEPAYLCKLISN